MSRFTSTLSKSTLGKTAIASVAIAAAIALPLVGSSAASAADAFFAPVAVDDEYSIVQDTVLTVGGVGVIANDTSSDAGQLLIHNMSLASSGHISGLGSSGYFTFTPDAGFVGDVTFTYDIQDQESGFFSNEATVVVHVTAAPLPAPVANPDNYSTPQDTLLTVDAASGLLANDVSASHVFYQNNTTGQLSLNGAGDFTYLPAPGFVGTATFYYAITGLNGQTSASALVTIEVTAPVVSIIPSNPLPGNPGDGNPGNTPTDDGVPTLAYTGATTSWLVAPALALLAAGLGGIWFAAVRRRRAAAL